MHFLSLQSANAEYEQHQFLATCNNPPPSATVQKPIFRKTHFLNTGNARKFEVLFFFLFKLKKISCLISMLPMFVLMLWKLPEITFIIQLHTAIIQFLLTQETPFIHSF